MSPCTILRALQSVNPTARYWLFSLASDCGIDVPDALDEVAPDDVASDELGDGDGATTGGVFAGLADEPDGAAGLIVDEEDVDGEGVTTGGVFVVDGVDDSRLQPATPSTRPAQTSVAIALFIAISKRVEKRDAPRGDLADSVPSTDESRRRARREMPCRISAVVVRIHRVTRARGASAAHAARAIFTGGW